MKIIWGTELPSTESDCRAIIETENNTFFLVKLNGITFSILNDAIKKNFLTIENDKLLCYHTEMSEYVLQHVDRQDIPLLVKFSE